jgi:hypothetical protein
MADFDTETTSVRWYNILSFHFMQPEVKRPVQPASRNLAHPKQVPVVLFNSYHCGVFLYENDQRSARPKISDAAIFRPLSTTLSPLAGYSAGTGNIAQSAT